MTNDVHKTSAERTEKDLPDHMGDGTTATAARILSPEARESATVEIKPKAVRLMRETDPSISDSVLVADMVFDAFVPRPIILRAQKINRDFEIDMPDGGVQTGKAGDFACIDSDGNLYPCIASVFEKRWDRMTL